MDRRAQTITFALAGMFLLGGCRAAGFTVNPDRVELPQRMRMAEDGLLSSFERKSGRIAVVTVQDTLEVIDQAGSNRVALTRNRIRATTRGSNLNTVVELPVWSPDGRSLAFSENVLQRPTSSVVVEVKPERVIIEHGQDSERVEVNPEATDPAARARPVPITEQTTTETKPDRVMIFRGDGDATVQSSALYVVSADGKRPINELAFSNRESIKNVSWSPDGRQLAYASEGAPNAGVKLNVVAAEGGAPRELASSANAVWAWAPDSASLLARLDRGTRDLGAAFSVINPLTGQQSPPRQTLAMYRSPQLSPDGKYQLVTRPNGQLAELWLAQPDGTPERRLLSNVNGVISFAWAPVGNRFAYNIISAASQRGSALHLYSLENNDDKIISSFPVRAYQWSPDGNRILTFVPVRSADVEPGFQGIDVLEETSTTGWELGVITLSEQSMLLRRQVAIAPETRRLFIFEPPDTFGNVLNNFERFSRSGSLWSPDSRHFVFTVSLRGQQGPNDIVVQSESSGSLAPRVLGRGKMAVWSPK